MRAKMMEVKLSVYFNYAPLQKRLVLKPANSHTEKKQTRDENV